MIKSSVKTLQAPWEKRKAKMLLAHFSEAELDALNKLQGGEFEDKETGIPTFKKLDKIISDPKTHALLVDLWKEVSSQSPKKKTLYEKHIRSLEKKGALSVKKTYAEENSPEIKRLEKDGTHGDTRIAWIPESFVELAIEAGYKPRVNKKDGLLMFFWAMAIPAVVSALGFLGEKEKHSHDRKQHEAQLAYEREREAKIEAHRRASGFYDQWEPEKIPKRKRRPFHVPTAEELKYGISYKPDDEEEERKKGGMVYRKGGMVHIPNHDQSKLQSVTEGTLIKGPGKGQQDLIKTSVPENSYIIDASTTSMLGDGSSDAGAHVLKQFEEEIKKKFPRKKAVVLEQHLEKTTPQLPVWLSDSEYKFDPLTVTMLGEGSNIKGAEMLKHMVKNIRADKSKSGGGLPKKAHSPWHYIQKRRR